MILIKAKNLKKEFFDEPRIVAYEDVNFEIQEGEFVCMLGPSGSGKSALLRTLSGAIKQTEGDLFWGENQKKEKDEFETAMVFQQGALFPWLTVSENIEFGLKMRGVEKSARHETSINLLKKMNLIKYADTHPKLLSGGIKQRVGIARALALDPKIILMDEPFSALDVASASELRQFVLKIWKEEKKTIIMVTHFPEEASLMAERIIILSALPSHVVDDFRNPLPYPRNPQSDEFESFKDKLVKMVD
jgi:NitT/TauT family transport system ATP-binding protein